MKTMMKTMKTTMMVTLVVMIVAATSAEASLAPGPEEEALPPYGYGIFEETFQGCTAYFETEREVYECALSEGYDFVSAITRYLSQCFSDADTLEVSCPNCPPAKICSAISGLCVQPPQDKGFQKPGLIDDCSDFEEGYECYGFDGIRECTDPNFAGEVVADCSCFESGGTEMLMSDCLGQCGAIVSFVDDDDATAPGVIGMPAPSVCCIAGNKCPDFTKYNCFDESACFLPLCDGFGNVSCDPAVGNTTLVEVQGHPVCGN